MSTKKPKDKPKAKKSKAGVKKKGKDKDELGEEELEQVSGGVQNQTGRIKYDTPY